MAMKLVPEMEADRVLAAVRNAPIVVATPEEMAAFEEGRADIRAGRTVGAAEVRARRKARAQD